MNHENKRSYILFSFALWFKDHYYFYQVFDYDDAAKKPLQDDSDSEDDISSYHDNSDSSDEDETEIKKIKVGDLEWDDSTM